MKKTTSKANDVFPHSRSARMPTGPIENTRCPCRCSPGKFEYFKDLTKILYHFRSLNPYLKLIEDILNKKTRKTYQAIIGFDGENLVGDGGEIHLPAQPFI